MDEGSGAVISCLMRRAADRLDVAVPDQGMHLVVYLCDGSSDIAIEAAAQHCRARNSPPPRHRRSTSPSPHRRWARASTRPASRKLACRLAGRRGRMDSGYSRRRRRKARPLGSVAQAPNGAGAAIRLPPTASFNLAQLAALGQAASPGRTRLEAAAALAATRNRKSGCRATTAAIPLSMSLLSISHLCSTGSIP